MRLIDVHRILDNISKNTEVVDLVEDIINAPTVNAIPVEWIIKWSAEHLQEYGTVTIERMLEDWNSQRSSANAVKKTS